MLSTALKAEGRYKGRPRDRERNASIARMLNAALVLGRHPERHRMQPRDDCQNFQAHEVGRLIARRHLDKPSATANFASRR